MYIRTGRNSPSFNLVYDDNGEMVRQYRTLNMDMECTAIPMTGYLGNYGFQSHGAEYLDEEIEIIKCYQERKAAETILKAKVKEREEFKSHSHRAFMRRGKKFHDLLKQGERATINRMLSQRKEIRDRINIGEWFLYKDEKHANHQHNDKIYECLDIQTDNGIRELVFSDGSTKWAANPNYCIKVGRVN